MAQSPIIMLGIESSCDETAAAIVAADKTIYANEIASQIETHAKHGGVVPEVAARAHLEMIDQVIRDALATASLTMGDINAVAATGGPGLIGGDTSSNDKHWLIGIIMRKLLAKAG